MLEFLKPVIDSDVHALVNSEEHRLTRYDNEPDFEPEAKAESSESLMLSHEETLESENEYRQLMDEIEESCSNDEDECLILMAYKELADSEQGLKSELPTSYTGLGPQRVRNAKRRIERKARALVKRVYEREERSTGT